MLYRVGVGSSFDTAVLEQEVAIKVVIDGDVNVSRYGCSDEESVAVRPIVRGQVGAATTQGDA
jgi:hypothetical protein